MLRVIIAALLIYAVWAFWKRSTRRRRKTPAQPTPSSPAEMIACNRCGTFVLECESISRGGERFCCEGCAAKNDS